MATVIKLCLFHFPYLFLTAEAQRDVLTDLFCLLQQRFFNHVEKYLKLNFRFYAKISQGLNLYLNFFTLKERGISLVWST